MSCSARLPVYVVFGLAFFGTAAATVITGLYCSASSWRPSSPSSSPGRCCAGRSDAVFALELPPYRVADPRALVTPQLAEDASEFVVKAGTVIFALAVLLWCVMSLPWGVTSQRDSYFGQASAALAPVFAPAGFGTWEASGALVTGFVAKEVVVTTMAQTYVPSTDEAGPGGASSAEPAAEPVPTVAEDLVGIGGGFLAATDSAIRSTLSIIPGVDVLPDEAAEPQETALSAALATSFAPLAGLAFVVFVLIYTPCVATLSAIRSEFGWRWAAFSGAYQLGLAWLLAVVVFQVGTFLGMA